MFKKMYYRWDFQYLYILLIQPVSQKVFNVPRLCCDVISCIVDRGLVDPGTGTS